jgi:hypothetical protein
LGAGCRVQGTGCRVTSERHAGASGGKVRSITARVATKRVSCMATSASTAAAANCAKHTTAGMPCGEREGEREIECVCV